MPREGRRVRGRLASLPVDQGPEQDALAQQRTLDGGAGRGGEGGRGGAAQVHTGHTVAAINRL